MQTKKIIHRIFQTLAIVVLVLALISTSVYLLISKNLNDAYEQDTIPNIFGYSYIPVLTSNTENAGIGEIGDLLLFKPLEASDSLTVGNTVLFKIPDKKTTTTEGTIEDLLLQEIYTTDINTNLSLKFYTNYCIGIISSVDMINEENVYYIQVDKDSSQVIVPSSTYFEKGMFSFSVLGAIVDVIASNLGSIYLVAIPIVAFIILQLIALIMRTLFSAYYIEEDYEDFEDDLEDEYEANAVTSSDPTDFSKTQQFPIRSKVSTEVLPSFELEKTPIDKASKEPSLSELNEVIQDIPNIPLIDQLIKSETISTLNSDFLPSNSELDASTSTTSSDNLPPFLTKVPSSSRSFDATSLLDAVVPSPSINATDAHTNMGHTMEFDFDMISKGSPSDEKSKQAERENFIKLSETFSLNNFVSVHLKENAIDFDFNNILTPNIIITPCEDQSGFTITTPNYCATLKIDISKLK